jgi:hypothetical protein
MATHKLKVECCAFNPMPVYKLQLSLAEAENEYVCDIKRYSLVLWPSSVAEDEELGYRGTVGPSPFISRYAVR